MEKKKLSSKRQHFSRNIVFILSNSQPQSLTTTLILALLLH